MKKISLFSLLVIFTLVLKAQTPLDAVVQGTIINAKESYIELKYLNNPLDDSLSTIKVELNESGQFYQELPIKRPLELVICYLTQKAPLYIEPEERIEISALADDIFRSINYVSKFYNNHYLIDFQKKYSKQRNINQRNDHIIKDDLESYFKYEDDLAKEKLLFLENYHKENPLSLAFMKRQQASINYAAANYKYTFSNNYKKLTNTEKEFPVSNYRFMMDLPVNENELITVPEFFEFLDYRFDYEFRTKQYPKQDDSELIANTINIVLSMCKDRVLNIFFTKKFAELLDKYPYKYTSAYISIYMTTVYPTEYRKYIDKKIEAAQKRDKN